MRRRVGDHYYESLPRLYGEGIHGDADLVCYWFDKAQRMVADGNISRSGLVATNSIRGGRSRAVLDRIVDESTVFEAWSDEPWVVDGLQQYESL